MINPISDKNRGLSPTFDQEDEQNQLGKAEHRNLHFGCCCCCLKKSNFPFTSNCSLYIMRLSMRLWSSSGLSLSKWLFHYSKASVVLTIQLTRDDYRAFLWWFWFGALADLDQTRGPTFRAPFLRNGVSRDQTPMKSLHSEKPCQTFNFQLGVGLNCWQRQVQAQYEIFWNWR